MLPEKHNIAPYFGICDRVQQATYLEGTQASQMAIGDTCIPETALLTAPA